MPSTAIGKIEYDDETERLFVDFVTNGRRYGYFDVPLEAYDAFRYVIPAKAGTHGPGHIQ